MCCRFSLFLLSHTSFCQAAYPVLSEQVSWGVHMEAFRWSSARCLAQRYLSLDYAKYNIQENSCLPTWSTSTNALSHGDKINSSEWQGAWKYLEVLAWILPDAGHKPSSAIFH